MSDTLENSFQLCCIFRDLFVASTQHYEKRKMKTIVGIPASFKACQDGNCTSVRLNCCRCFHRNQRWSKLDEVGHSGFAGGCTEGVSFMPVWHPSLFFNCISNWMQNSLFCCYPRICIRKSAISSDFATLEIKNL